MLVHQSQINHVMKIILYEPRSREGRSYPHPPKNELAFFALIGVLTLRSEDDEQPLAFITKP